ncbi:transposase [Photorhabdus asymbiotica]|uniref:transposase n=1 Tax=Photorhabdus asymbiotica TaxID=291112 RepID=UPI003DA6EF99
MKKLLELHQHKTDLTQQMRSLLTKAEDEKRSLTAEEARSDGRVKFDYATYRRRNVVERCFGRLKEYRRIATRYEKTARNFIAMVKLGCIRLFLKTII